MSATRYTNGVELIEPFGIRGRFKFFECDIKRNVRHFGLPRTLSIAFKRLFQVRFKVISYDCSSILASQLNQWSSNLNCWICIIDRYRMLSLERALDEL